MINFCVGDIFTFSLLFLLSSRDEDFNDVVLKEEVEDVVGGAEREDLSQEKSRVGLGEV